MQVDTFEDNGIAMLLLYPEGGRTFAVPRELLPRKAQPGDVFEVSFTHDRQETEQMATENKRLMDELLERNG